MLRKKSKQVPPVPIKQLPEYICEPVETVHGQIVMKKYLKIKSIGQGSYSKCFLVRNTSSESTYAVKIIPKNKLQILIREKLVYEIKIHQSLIHENIVYFDHWFEDEDYQYIFMEYCANGNLDSYVKSQASNVPESEIKKFGWQIVSAIKYIHEQKILHRDLKLCNFYLTENNQVKLGDFGFACQLANFYDKKRQSCGTPNYIAPQAISGFGYSYSSDVWSIGVIFFRMKFGFCPFEGINVRQTLEKVKCCQYRFPKNIKISAQLKDLIERILNINYDERITTAEILDHPFFSDLDVDNLYGTQKQTKKQKKSASLFAKLFSRSPEKAPNQNSKIQIFVNDQNANNKPVTSITNPHLNKSNSCETLKQIKSIFKSKSKEKGNLQSNTTMYSQPSYMTIMSNRTLSDKQQLSSILYSSKGNSQQRYEDHFTTSICENQNKKQQNCSRVSRLNQFIKSRAQTILNNDCQTPKLTPYMKLNKVQSLQEKKNNIFISQICQEHRLPTEIQYQKDIIIVHYQGNIKQIITQNQPPQKNKQKYDIKSFSDTTIDTNNSALKNAVGIGSKNIGFQTCYILYMDENPFLGEGEGKIKIYKSDALDKQVYLEELPKLVAYIIENKIKWQKSNTKQQQNSEIFADKMLCDYDIYSAMEKISHNWLICKEGLILKYSKKKHKQRVIEKGQSSDSEEFMISKMFSQKYFYIQNIDKIDCDKPKSTKKQTQLIYGYDSMKRKYEIIDQVGILRMYMGWSRINSKNFVHL